MTGPRDRLAWSRIRARDRDGFESLVRTWSEHLGVSLTIRDDAGVHAILRELVGFDPDDWYGPDLSRLSPTATGATPNDVAESLRSVLPDAVHVWVPLYPGGGVVLFDRDVLISAVDQVFDDEDGLWLVLDLDRGRGVLVNRSPESGITLYRLTTGLTDGLHGLETR